MVAKNIRNEGNMTGLQKKTLSDYAKIQNMLSESKSDSIQLPDDVYGSLYQTIDLLINQDYLQKLPFDNGNVFRKCPSFDFFEDNYRLEIGEPLPKLFSLKREEDALRSKFTVVGGFKSIHTEESFIRWKNAVDYELTKLTQHEQVNKIKQYFNSFNGWNDEKFFTEVVAGLKVICDNYDEFIPNNIEAIDTQVGERNMKTPKVFISHSSKDKEYVGLLVDLLEDIGLSKDTLFCSSVQGFGIPLGKTIFQYLRDEFDKFDLHVIFVHSHNFYSSPVCLNEMGAAWVAQNKVTSVLLPDFGYSDMKGVVSNQDISIKLDDPDKAEVTHRLNELYQTLLIDFEVPKKNESRWEYKRDKFIEDSLDITSK